MDIPLLVEALLAAHKLPKRCFIGFDGFTDEIVHAVDKRTSASQFLAMAKISDFAARVSKGSCNIELVPVEKRVGGNGPLLAKALLEGGHLITLAGMLGSPAIEPIFEELASRCEKVLSLGPSCHTDAIEFQDGKILLGKMAPPQYENIANKELIELLDRADLVATVNWTMTIGLTALWKRLQREIIPHFTTFKERRFFFVDLADPAKRSDEDLLEALQTLKGFSPTYEVVLGLNQFEAERVGRLLSPAEIKLVIHTKERAQAITESGLFEVKVPHVESLRTTTGAGDAFNAGYCNALLYGLSEEAALYVAVYTASFYVQEGRAPTIPELAQFLLVSRPPLPA